MQSLTAKRTLVKSPPELWSELSEIDRLAKHLEAFGEITITKVEPEHTVAWEGESASGTVSIEPSGWGTKVTMTALVKETEPEPKAAAQVEPEPDAEPDPDAEPEPDRLARSGFFARIFGRPPKRSQPPPEPGEPEPPASPPAPSPVDSAADRAKGALEDALEALGSAHHRPFSRG